MPRYCLLFIRSARDLSSSQDSGVHGPAVRVGLICDLVISHAFILAVNQLALGLIVLF